MTDFLTGVAFGLPAWIFIITLVVFVHEMGHFLIARAFKVTVQTFSIGFGREVVGWTDRKGTRWKISWIPFGGYVKFLGDEDASSKPDTEALKKLPAEARKNALHLKPLWQRALVVAAGPVANFILAVAIFFALALTREFPVSPPTISGVLPNSAAAAAGFQAGDVIDTVNGRRIGEFLEFQAMVVEKPGEHFHVVVHRGPRQIPIDVASRVDEVELVDGSKQRIGRIGLLAKLGPVSVPRAMGLAVGQTWQIISGTVSYLGQMVTGRASADQLRGPLGIATLSGKVAQNGFVPLLWLAGLISVSIGLLNLFPIPVLDGGHLLYYACEAILGRPLGERAQEVGFRLGLALVLGLLLLATFNDLMRFNLF